MDELFDHASPEFSRDPLTCFRRGRGVGAFRHGTTKWPLVSLFRYADIRRALADWRVWSSEIPAIRDLLLGDASVMVQDDPPRHTSFRRCLASRLTPQSLARDGFDISQVVEDRVSILFRGAGDAVEEVGAQIALDVVCRIVGLPDRERDYLRDWTNRFSAIVGAEFVSTDQQVLDAQRRAVAIVHNELSEYIRRCIRDGTGRAGLISESADWPISPEERVGLIKSIAFAGNHTSALMIANTLWLFATFPSELERLIDGASVATAVEEILRYKAVFRGITRIATRDGSICDVPYQKGDNLILWLTSGNFDEERFVNPENFDIARRDAAHVAFAVGPHHCVGASLARAEIYALVTMLQRRARRVRLEGAPKPSTDPWVDGFEELNVSLAEREDM